MKAKKIAIVYSGAKYWGGIENYLENLFMNADLKKVELTLFSLGEWELSEKMKAKSYKVKIFAGGRVNLVTIFRLAKELKGFDLVVSQGVVANAYARSASILSGVPNLVTIHSDFVQDYPNRFVRLCYLASDRVVRWRTKRYVAVSEFLKTKLIGQGVDGARISVIYNAVEAPKNIKQHKKGVELVIGSVGRLHQVKNFDNLIRAMVLVPKASLKIWGDGPERTVLESLIHELELGDRVKLMGFAENVWTALESIDLYVQPSISEGFGLVVVEAMCAGVPVVVTPGGSLPELVENGVTGMIASGFGEKEIAKSINDSIAQVVKIEKNAARAREQAKKRFNLENWVNETVDAYVEAAK